MRGLRMGQDVTKEESAVERILERLPIPVVIASPVTGKILWVNSRLVKMAAAQRPADLVGKSLLDFIEPPQQGVALADLAKVALGASPPPVIYNLKRATGELAAGMVSSVAMLFRGQPAMLSLVTDVSERERLIRELAESEERYRLIIENSPSGVVVVVDDHVAYANQALAAALGLSGSDEVIGRSMYDFIVPEQRKPVREARRQVLMTGETFPAAPVTLLRSDGTTFDTTAVTTRIRWEGEIATQTLMHDLTSAR